MNHSDHHEAFIERVRSTLDESSALDAGTSARLRAARRRAVEAAAGAGTWRRVWIGFWHGKRSGWTGGVAGGLALAGAALVAVMLWHPGVHPAARVTTPGDLELLSSNNSLEFYRDLDFYQWLQETQSNAG